MIGDRKNKLTPSEIGWRILRTKPLKKTPGFAIPAFIHNFDYHFTTVDVYADGVIDCWGFVDQQLFQGKIASGWVATEPEKGQQVSIHNLGSATVSSADWLLKSQDIVSLVEDALKELNPELKHMIDMEGDDTEVRDGVRHAKLGLADEKPYRLNADHEEILGKELPIIVRTGEEYELSHWFIYTDSKTQIGYGSNLLSMEEVSSRFQEGTCMLSVPDEAWLHIPPLGRFKTQDGYWVVDFRERIREAMDELEMLTGGSGTILRCREALSTYKQDSTKKNEEHLRAAYEAVPEHLQMYCGDMDSKDWPIRRILYGDEHEDDLE